MITGKIKGMIAVTTMVKIKVLNWNEYINLGDQNGN